MHKAMTPLLLALVVSAGAVAQPAAVNRDADIGFLENVLAEQRAFDQTASFTPMDIGDALRTEMVISSDGSRLLSWRTYNVKPFKPNNALKVKDFKVSATFTRPEGFNADVLLKQENYIFGHAFLVKKVEEKWSNTYSDYDLEVE